MDRKQNKINNSFVTHKSWESERCIKHQWVNINETDGTISFCLDSIIDMYISMYFYLT